ncbi:hypothetical protein MAFF211479_18280 [Ralstonia solanacearum]|nr:hypothetical protein MAFF211479_18280 [Ralstonia solanacearum]BCN04691.1 hypothetical protein RPSB_18280 [Ralstonia solanacearum]BCN10106.1 hypothetical protein RPSD_19910 [Ralstonia solanacearum]
MTKTDISRENKALLSREDANRIAEVLCEFAKTHPPGQLSAVRIALRDELLALARDSAPLF